LGYTYHHDFSDKENLALDGQLIQPLKLFLLSLDKEFNTNYFYEKIEKLKRKYIKRNYILDIRVVNHRNKPVKKVDVKISDANSPTKNLLSIMKTDKYGIISLKLPENTYEMEIEKYSLKKVYGLHEHSKVRFVLPKKKHWWQ
jgi:hypothetical protein